MGEIWLMGVPCLQVSAQHHRQREKKSKAQVREEERERRMKGEKRCPRP